jgi:AcrR family transcriptional regulator
MAAMRKRGGRPRTPSEHAAAKPVKSARQRVLDAAMELFYRDGIRAVGIDTVIACSGVAKMSLYRSFPSKDDLIVAVLQAYDAAYWARWDKAMAEHPGDPRQQVSDVFAMLARRIANPRFRGCAFMNAAIEFPDPAHPARAVSRANKRQLQERLRQLALRLGASSPEFLADHLHLLIEGAYASAHTLPRNGPAPRLREAAEALVAAHTASAAHRGAR